MLAFGLTVIFLFVRLHGDGYDFPVRVSKCNDTVVFSRSPDRTFMEVSSVYKPEDVLFTTLADFDPSDESTDRREQEDGARKTAEKEANAGAGGIWQSQWLKMTGSKDDVIQQQQQGRDSEIRQSDRQWIWMTNLWYDDGNCGPGHIRQYRRPLDKALESDNTTSWEHMYTHKLPGPIVHTSLSKRVLPDHLSGRPGSATTQEPSSDKKDTVINDYEVIRLAVMYKIVRDERVSYHVRIYHFGVFSSSRADLRADCGSISTENCHSHAPFQSFDYIFPGSTAIKDFSLEHDRILYSRLSDVAHFRTLLLPRLQPGETSLERPFVLASGRPGPELSCRERQNTPYRMSFLAQFEAYPKTISPYVIMAKVVESRDRDVWEYHLSIADEHAWDKNWNIDPQWSYRYQSLVQENDLINEDPYIHGDSIQRPYMVRSADGKSFHIPVKNWIRSLSVRPPSPPNRHVGKVPSPQSLQRRDEALLHLENYRSNGQRKEGEVKVTLTSRDDDGQHQSLEDLPIAAHESVDANALERRHREEQMRFSQASPEYFFMTRHMQYESAWSATKIESGPMESADTEQGVINDRDDVMALKTSHNGILVLRRSLEELTPWRLSMVMSDDEYFERSAAVEREVLAMKIVRAIPVHEASSQSGAQPESTSKQRDDDPAGIPSESVLADDSSPVSAEPEKAAQHQNILLMVFGDGRLRGYNLDQPQETSSMMSFLVEKYQVVIGMLAVVIAFVINEAR
ncbi:hypothetical protein BGZ83_005608 [Gryganskiella cystojenkinii]|nr:hypothetical protein BGZ83_005608 [Gryganskiella cystojenkinii]